jgi:crotonobetainyl-CoA:carnitine CoA-transferase CaiB-like acyl-CoA transferase
VTPILSAKEALGHPLFKARNMVETVTGPLGTSQMPTFPIRFVGEDQATSAPAKARGADQAILDKFRE